MAADRILINVAPGETRIASLSGSRLCQMTIIREGAENIAGNIYLGRVEAVVDGLQAAFINIGLARSGFLALADARPHGHDDVHDIANYVAEGDAVTVQVLRDPAEDKGAKLTTRIGLTGRDIVYRPGQPGIFVSRRIDEEVERRRLTTLVEAMADDEEGFILRTAAAEADEDDLARDVNRLRGLWGAIQGRRDQAKAPHCLYSETEPLFAFLRDHGGGNLEAVTADNTETVFQLRSFAEDEMPEIAQRIRTHTSRHPLFDADDVEAMIRYLEQYIHLVGNMIFAALAISYMARIDVAITAVTVVPCVLIVTIVNVARRHIQRYRTAQRQATEAATNPMTNHFRNGSTAPASQPASAEMCPFQ